MENHHFVWVNPLFLWPFSIAMLNYQRVTGSHGHNCTVSERRVWDFVIRVPDHRERQFNKHGDQESPLIGDQIIHRIWWIGMTYDIYIYIIYIYI